MHYFPFIHQNIYYIFHIFEFLLSTAETTGKNKTHAPIIIIEREIKQFEACNTLRFQHVRRLLTQYKQFNSTRARWTLISINKVDDAPNQM